MSVARKDDRHNEDLAREIADSFNESVRSKNRQVDDEDGGGDDVAEPGQRFVITGDQRTSPHKRRGN